MACSPTDETARQACYGSCGANSTPGRLPCSSTKCHSSTTHRCHPQQRTEPRQWWPERIKGSRRGSVTGGAMFFAAIASIVWMLHSSRDISSTATPETHDDHVGVSSARTGSPRESLAPGRPNVVFVMIDDMGFNDIGYQSTDMQEMTPILDQLASEGIKLSTYYSMYICTPARGALMTGRYPLRYGLQFEVMRPLHPWGLPLTEKLLPQYLKEVGYETHIVGKWHLGFYMRKYLPSERGFDTFLGYLCDQEDYWTHQSYSQPWEGRLFSDFGYGDKDGFVTAAEVAEQQGTEYVGQYSTSVFTDRAVDLIQRHDPQDMEHPLFLYLAHQAVHSPLGIPPEEDFSEAELEVLARAGGGEPKRQRFAKVLMYLDKSVNRVIQALRDTGHLDNTIVVVASDNGGCPLNGGSNYPLRGMKHTYWEGGNRVPAFIWSPSHLPLELSGTTYSGMMHVTDWLPTLMGLSGVSSDPANQLDGVDQWAAIIGQAPEPPRTEVLYNMDVYQFNGTGTSQLGTYPATGAVRVGKWKLIKNDWCEGYHSWNPNDTIVETCSELGQCWRRACGATCWGDPEIKAADFLFDLEADPTERFNLYHEHPEIVQELTDRMTELSEGWVESGYAAEDFDAIAVWTRHDGYLVPWFNTEPSPQPDAPNAPHSAE